MRLLDIPLSESLIQARRIYPPREQERGADWHICMSNAKRRRVNSVMQGRAAVLVADDQKVWVDGETPYYCFAGTKLTGANSTLRPIINGAFLIVTKISATKETVFLKDEDIGGEEFEVTIHQLIKHTRLRHALTLRSAQGRSLHGTITIHDVSSTHFSSTHLYVALSRATRGRDVSIERS